MVVLYIGKHHKMFHVNDHSHSYCELIYCTGGSGSIVTSQNTAVYQEGELVIVPAHMPHQNLSQSGFSNLYIAVEGAFERLERPKVVRDNEAQDLWQILEQLHRHFHADFEGRSAILAGLARAAEGYMSVFSGMARYSSLVERIEQEIIDRFADSSFTADEALGHVQYSREYARKQFMKERGVSPHGLLSSIRLEHAHQLLLQRKRYGLNISQIAAACGFADPLYFSRIYKKCFGVSPNHASISDAITMATGATKAPTISGS